jgi:hypothetical protein
LGLFPYLDFAIYATGRDRFEGYYEVMGTVANAMAGLLTIYFFSFLSYGEYFVAMALISTMFFGFYINRLRFVYGTIAALTYVVGFQIYLIAQPNSVVTQPVILSTWLWAILLLAISAGHYAERNFCTTGGRTAKKSSKTNG